MRELGERMSAGGKAERQFPELTVIGVSEKGLMPRSPGEATTSISAELAG